MYEWLEREIASIGTPKFHVVSGPPTEEEKAMIAQSAWPFPPSYKQFVLTFGHTLLYRQKSIYLVEVLTFPREAILPQGDRAFNFGRTDLGLVYFLESHLAPNAECPVFQTPGESSGIEKIAESFRDWLTTACRAARKLYSKKRWADIEAGPVPFSPEELAIVDARRYFRWRVVGVSKEGNIRFEIHNGSQRRLPFLSLGVRGKHGSVQGGVWLPVSHITPGSTAVVEKDCYRDLLAPSDVEVFDKPDPGPEDRDVYWEFRPIR